MEEEEVEVGGEELTVSEVGKPIEVPKIDEPTNEDIEEYHIKFTAALTELFEEQKYNYLENPEDKKLIII
ncbi:hypothetical protein NQ318_011796 [Aromia moschata]|uniref:Uncharacterized protein n=1 Tax=Aromia moschata TaxID=1265417 RepID=A0AAV8Y647_9CUCU|nr:hypothetical protein NQ318_011796 [Aromia moschata]